MGSRALPNAGGGFPAKPPAGGGVPSSDGQEDYWLEKLSWFGEMVNHQGWGLVQAIQNGREQMAE